MVTEIKYVILLLFISMFASETIRNADGDNTFLRRQIFAVFDDCGFFTCLNEIKCCFLTHHSSNSNKNSSTNDDNDSGEIQKKGKKKTPCFYEFLMHTTNHFPQDKWKPYKPPYAKIIQEKLNDESIPCQSYRNDVFMPDLQYYIYTLEKIVI